MRQEAGARKPTGTEGFSLLEALAALLVISVALIPLFQMQAALSDASRRAKLQAERVLSSVDVMAFFSTLNPMAEPDGEQAFDGARLSWTATEIERINRVSPLQPQDETVALFLVNITISDNQGEPIITDTVYLVGWSETQRPALAD